MVCVSPRSLRFRRYAESVRDCCGTRSGVWECEADGPSCGTFVLRTPEAENAFDRLAYTRLLFQESIAVVGRAWFQGGCAWFGEVVWRRRCV